MKENLLYLIRERTGKVVLAVEMLMEKFGDINFTLAKNSGLIPKSGFLGAAESVSYNLHGRGVDVDFGDERIEFDFNFKNKNHTGFNRWQLNGFLSRHRNNFNNLADLSVENIESLLADLEREDQIQFEAAENLYYLSDNLKSATEPKMREVEMALS